mgnify:CR=1 FL=1
MGIQDRAYIRDKRPPSRPAMLGPGGPSGWSVNTWLIVINLSIFVLQIFLATVRVPVYQGTEDYVERWPSQTEVRPGYYVSGQRVESLSKLNRGIGGVDRLIIDRETQQVVARMRYTIMDPLTAYGHFSTAKGTFAVDHRGIVLSLEVWRLVTFQFLHANIIHIFFNMLGLFIFGSMVERFLGSKRYLAFYLVCGIFGGLAYLLLNLAGQVLGPEPGLLMDSPYVPLVGASAGVFGVIMAAAFIAPNSIIQLLIPPIPLKLKYFAYGYVGIALANLLLGGENAGGDAAHIGGAIAGYFFIRRSHLLRDFFDVLGDSRKPTSKASGANIDDILDKVSQKGLGSLTKKERERLRKASSRSGPGR